MCERQRERHDSSALENNCSAGRSAQILYLIKRANITCHYKQKPCLSKSAEALSAKCTQSSCNQYFYYNEVSNDSENIQDYHLNLQLSLDSYGFIAHCLAGYNFYSTIYGFSSL